MRPGNSHFSFHAITDKFSCGVLTALPQCWQVGLAREQSTYVLTRHPRILAYSLADTLRPHLAFLYELGIAKSNIAKVPTRSALSLGCPSPQQQPRLSLESPFICFGGSSACLSRICVCLQPALWLGMPSS